MTPRSRGTAKRALVGNASDVDQVKRAANTTRAQRERERNNRHAVRATRQGRAVLWKLLGDAGLLETSFSSDPLYMAYREGRRSVALQHLHEWDSEDPDSYLLAQQESIEDDRQIQPATEPTPEPSDEPAP